LLWNPGWPRSPECWDDMHELSHLTLFFFFYSFFFFFGAGIKHRVLFMLSKYSTTEFLHPFIIFI
jgi:hypothetical protein